SCKSLDPREGERGSVPGAGVRGIDHVALSVRDLEASVKFYTSVMGLEEVGRSTKRGGYFDVLVGAKDATFEIAYIKIPGSGFTLELIEAVNPKGEPLPQGHVRNPGTVHLCFEVDDVHAVYEKITALGLPV